MKRIFAFCSLLMAAGMMYAADYTVYQTVGSENIALTDGQKITITDYAVNEWTGKTEMQFVGGVRNDGSMALSAFYVTATRDVIGDDEFCFLVCEGTNGKNSQTFNYIKSIPAQETITYKADYYPTEAGVYTVQYRFYTGTEEGITVTVEYNYQPTAITNVYSSKAVTVTNGGLNWNFDQAAARTFVVLDLTGKVAYKQQVKESRGQAVLDLKQGIYILAVQEKGVTVMNKKVIIK